MEKRVRIQREVLEKFCTDIFLKLGLPFGTAKDSAEILVAADARGIASHGVARMWRYENGIKKGLMAGGVQPTVLRETPISKVLDAKGAMGMGISRRTMQWAVDTSGRGTSDAHKLLDDMLYQRGGGIMPLGGEGELLGGHKGFGLATMVDILTDVTSGGDFGSSVMDSEATSARVCHFFGALQLNLFRDTEEFKADMDRMLDELTKATTPSKHT